MTNNQQRNEYKYSYHPTSNQVVMSIMWTIGLSKYFIRNQGLRKELHSFCLAYLKEDREQKNDLPRFF